MHVMRETRPRRCRRRAGANRVSARISAAPAAGEAKPISGPSPLAGCPGPALGVIAGGLEVAGEIADFISDDQITTRGPQKGPLVGYDVSLASAQCAGEV